MSIFLVIAAVYITGRFVLTSSIPTRAEKGNVEKVELINLYPNQVSIAWISENKETGWVLYGTSPESLKNSAADIRDTTNQRGLHKNHFVIIKDLSSSTKYYALILSGDKLIYDSNDLPFEFTTPSDKVETNSSLKPAYGKVFDSENNPLKDVLVFLSINGMKKLGALSTQSGEWVIPLNFFLDDSLKQAVPTQETVVNIEMFGKNGAKSSINAHISDITPLNQDIILGRNYDTLSNDEVLGSSTGGTITLDVVDFLYPRENSVIPASSPLIKGVALPGSIVLLTLQGNNNSKTYSLKSDSEGQWSLNTISTLAPGKYSVTASSNDESGKKIESKRTFTIAKSGEQVLGDSTPSAI
ncbi:MAG: Ig-like domain-containing protein, partial [Patescibacteria group bacterium]